jgi:hypothetical protein
MGGLICRDFLQVLIKRVGKARRQEIVTGVIGEAGAVKSIFKVLQGEGIVENVGLAEWNDCS